MTSLEIPIKHLNNQYSCFGITISGYIETSMFRGPFITVSYRNQSYTQSISRHVWEDAIYRGDIAKLESMVGMLVNTSMEMICKNLPPTLPHGRNDYLTYQPPPPTKAEIIPQKTIDRIASALLYEIEHRKKECDRNRVPAFCYPDTRAMLNERKEILGLLTSVNGERGP